jgi:hypothetical protein
LRVGLVLVSCLLGLVLSAGPLQAADAPPDSVAHVTYLVGSSVYVDAGRDRGLTEGTELAVYRDGQHIGTLVVTYLSSRRSSCEVLDSTLEIELGDEVRIPASLVIPVAAVVLVDSVEVTQTTTSSTGFSRSQQNWPRSIGFQGRLGARFLMLRDQSGFGEDFNQPALDLYLLGTRIAGSPIDMIVDVRARRTFRTLTTGAKAEHSLTRVYRLAVAGQALGSPLRFSLGRQVSTNFASVSIFDGLLVEYLKPRYALGAFAGSLPEPENFGFSTEVMEFGFYGRWQNAGPSLTRWGLTGGWITSYASGTPSREYLFFRGQLSGGRIYGFANQEIDFNRGWKTEMGENSISPTSTYLSLGYRITRHINFSASYDNRRRVRLYRDIDTPESEFDDSFRRSLRVGADVRFWGRLGVSVGYRNGRGESAGNSDAYTAILRFQRLEFAHLDLALRGTRYTGPWADGWLGSMSLSRQFNSRITGEAHGGFRSEERALALTTENTITWIGLNVDIGISRGWYLYIDTEWTSSSIEKNNQNYASLSYRF